MRDKNFKELKEGQSVCFLIGSWQWYGKVLQVNNQEEKISIRVIKRETGVGLIEQLNYVECSNYITVL